VLFALNSPISLAGLALAFVLGLILRVVAIRVVQAQQRRRRGFGGRGYGGGPWFAPRRDIDVFGVVSAVIGGTGWGKKLEDDGIRPASVATLLAGPVTTIVAAQVVFAAYKITGGSSFLLDNSAASILYGAAGGGSTALEAFLLSLAVGLLCFGLLALIPLPPLDGWGLLRHAVRKPGNGFQKARYWLEEQNVGIAIVLAGMLLPIIGGLPLFATLFSLVSYPVMQLWA
jgi:Zn-dependent protease